jgi:D-alanyl-D-alanine carboxypeptidase
VIVCIVLLGLVAANNIQNGNQLNGQPNIIVSSTRSVSDQPDSTKDSIIGVKATTTKSVVVTPSDGISALAYIAANVLTDKVYAERNAKQVLPIASMSKLVTAFAATDMLPATTSITITKEEASAPPDGSGIGEGETYTLEEILYPLLLDSSNIAAEALASTTDRMNFLELMKSYAWEIGMSTAYFADPSGVDPHNRASAKDLFALAKYLYKFRPDILALTRVVSISTATTTEHDSHDFVSIHPFVTDPNFIGGKTGRTPEAGDTMLTIMRINDQPIAIIVLGSKYDGRADDTRKIIELVKKSISI